MRVLILGKGRIGKAVEFYLRREKIEVEFFRKEKEVKNFSLLINALPGEVGEKGLNLALRYGKDIIDISDIEPEFYLKKRKEIERKGILVIPNAGFCPGLINFILGNEILRTEKIEKIEVKAGTLSEKQFFFPFLWSFEDLILEHKLSSLQKINLKINPAPFRGEGIKPHRKDYILLPRTKGRGILKRCWIKKFPPFSGYQRENFFRIPSETYFASSGFEQLLKKRRVRSFIFRVIRPFGFFHFFRFLENQGFLEKENFSFTKKILEDKKEKDFTFSRIEIRKENKKIIWEVKCVSNKRERLNSMQKITSVFPAILLKQILNGGFLGKGLFFPEDIAREEEFFNKIIKEMRKENFLTLSRHSIKM